MNLLRFYRKETSIVHVTLVVCLVFSIILRLFFTTHYLSDQKLSIQQDHYADYAYELREGNISAYTEGEKRLLPGYPFLIVTLSVLLHSELLSGLVITYLSFILSVVLFYLLTKREWLTVCFMFFPPIWIYESAKVATEPLVVCLLLFSLWLSQKKKYFHAGLVIGCAFDVRLIAVCLLLALLLQHISVKEKLHILLGFFITGSCLFLYNIIVFGLSHAFIQFNLYPQVGKGSIGFIQIIQDIFRTIDWRQYRILVSGLFYLVLYILGIIILFKKRDYNNLYSLSFYWMVFSLLFIFFMGPTPLLEEFSRFTVPFVPALVMSFGSIVHRRKLP